MALENKPGGWRPVRGFEYCRAECLLRLKRLKAVEGWRLEPG
jgi:hypothetical protein